jgi:hypothetical protein
VSTDCTITVWDLPGGHCKQYPSLHFRKKSTFPGRPWAKLPLSITLYRLQRAGHTESIVTDYNVSEVISYYGRRWQPLCLQKILDGLASGSGRRTAAYGAARCLLRFCSAFQARACQAHPALWLA